MNQQELIFTIAAICKDSVFLQKTHSITLVGFDTAILSNSNSEKSKRLGIFKFLCFLFNLKINDRISVESLHFLT